MPEHWIARDRCAIVGIGTTAFTRDSGRSVLSLAVEASLAALADAGLSAKDVDGVVRGDMDPVWHNDLATSLGIPNLTYWGEAGPGGVGPCAMVGQAVGALLTGQAKTILAFRVISAPQSGAPISHGGKPASDPDDLDGTIAIGGHGSYDEFFAPFGALSPPNFFALLARRHMIECGTLPEHLGAVATAARARARANPNAQMQGPMSMDDYLESRMISDPLRLYDCCLKTDGAVAFVITTTERARDLRQRPALISGVAQGLGANPQGGVVLPALMREFISSSPGTAVARELYRRAGIGPEDVDVAQIYDCFTISVLLQLADYGFCKPDESGPFAASGALDIEGSLPINTSGGHLSEGYINGGNHVVEGVRQVRGESTSQIPGAEVCLVTSGPTIGTSALILRKD